MTGNWKVKRQMDFRNQGKEYQKGIDNFVHCSWII